MDCVCLLIFTLKSYTQDCSKEYSDSHLLGSNVERQVENCIKWQEPDPTLTNPDGSAPRRKCVESVSCNLQIPNPNEVIDIICTCYIRHSTKHPKYDHSEWPYWDSTASACTHDKAEEEAIKGCTDDFDLESENPEHWVTAITRSRVYKYICENGETLSR